MSPILGEILDELEFPNMVYHQTTYFTLRILCEIEFWKLIRNYAMQPLSRA